MSHFDEWLPYQPERSSVRFCDVGGCEEFKGELRLVLAQVRGQQHATIKCHAPSGVLLVGPPGVGKSHLARAIAGEARLPFFVISATELIEIFVGVGAHRVRTLFEGARRQKPSIVFIDEIDSIGRIRGGTTVIDNSERDHTLNALLHELDGFHSLEGVLVVAATSRYEMLDSALRRPGRFDVVFRLTYPNIADRQKVFTVLLRKVAKSKEIDDNFVTSLAEQTHGASQAEIDSIIRRASFLAVGRDADQIEASDLIDALAEWVKRGNQQLLDMFLTTSNGALFGAPIRPRTRLLLYSGELMEGYIQWQDSQYLKILTAEKPQGIIVSRQAVTHLEFVGNWESGL